MSGHVKKLTELGTRCRKQVSSAEVLFRSEPCDLPWNRVRRFYHFVTRLTFNAYNLSCILVTLLKDTSSVRKYQFLHTPWICSDILPNFTCLQWWREFPERTSGERTRKQAWNRENDVFALRPLDPSPIPSQINPSHVIWRTNFTAILNLTAKQQVAWNSNESHFASLIFYKTW